VRGVVSQVNGEINGVMNQVNGAVTDTVNQTGVNDTGMGSVVSSGDTNISGPSVQNARSTSSTDSAFWNDIWK
jgi:TraL protein